MSWGKKRKLFLAAALVSFFPDCLDVGTCDLACIDLFSSNVSSGTIGHVAHGKSTVVKAISGVKVHLFSCISWVIATAFSQTVRFKKELVSNITIKLGYANAKVCLPFSSFILKLGFGPPGS